MSGFISGKDHSAVEELLSQAKDLYVLEQVAARNCAGFTDGDSALPTNLEARLRRLKSLPVSRTDPSVSSSMKRLLSHSKSMPRYHGKKNLGNVSSASAFSIQVGKSCPLDSSVEETQIFSETRRNPNVNSRGGPGEFSDSGRIGSSSSRFSQQGKILALTTQTMKLLVSKEKSRISSSSLITSIDLVSPSSSSEQDQKEIMKRKSKLTSWFDKLSLAQAMGCFQGKSSSSSNSKRTKESIEELSLDEKFKRLEEEESKQRDIMVDKLIKKSRRLRSNYMRN